MTSFLSSQLQGELSTLTSEDKAEAVAFLVEGDIHRFGNDPGVVFGSCREIEASFESLCRISELLVDVPKAHSRRTKWPATESQRRLASLYFTGRGGRALEGPRLYPT